MNSVRQKFILLLADPSISRADFAAFCTWLQSGGIRKALDEAAEIRAILFRSPEGLADAAPDRPPSEPTHANPQLLDAILRLLIEEAALSRRTALPLLAKKLDYDGSIPVKKAFETGLMRLIEFAGPSAVLSAAQQIRNELVHHPNSLAWPLKDQQDEPARGPDPEPDRGDEKTLSAGRAGELQADD
jgi:hypothetical protein